MPRPLVSIAICLLPFTAFFLVVSITGIVEHYIINSYQRAVCFNPQELDIVQAGLGYEGHFVATFDGRNVSIQHPAQFMPIYMETTSEIRNTYREIFLGGAFDCIINGDSGFITNDNNVTTWWVTTVLMIAALAALGVSIREACKPEREQEVELV